MKKLVPRTAWKSMGRFAPERTGGGRIAMLKRLCAGSKQILLSNSRGRRSASDASPTKGANATMTVQGRVDRNRHDVSGRVGNGGYALNARTGSGHIRID